MKEDVMGGTCITHEEDKNVHRILVRNMKEDHLGELCVDGRIILKLILRK
jgi:hypothetical protein